MKLQKLLVSAVAAWLLVGASGAANACCVEFLNYWLLLGVESRFGTTIEAEKCSEAIGQVRQLGFRFKGMSHVTDNINVLYFEQGPRLGGDNIGLFCKALINEEP